MTFILYSHTHPIKALYGDKSSTTEKQTFKITKPAWIGRTTLPRETVEAPLKLIKMRNEFSKVDEEYPICL